MRRVATLPFGRLAVVATLLLLSCDVLTDLQLASINEVRVAPDSMDLVIGSSSHLRAFPLDTSGAFRPVGPTVWATSNPQIATVDDTGGVTGVGPGVATITATVKGITGTARIRVGPAPQITLSVDSIQFDAQAGQGSPPPQMVTITNGGGLTLSGLTVGAIDYGTGPQSWLITQFDSTTAPATLTVTAATGAITQAGTYTALVPISAPLANNSPQTLEVVLVLAPGPPATYQMTITAGNGQVAPAGSVLTTNPQVTITDVFANPIVGLPVTFLVTAGGGGITGATVNTDVNGKAAVGSWTVQAVGSVPADGRYVNQLQASAPSAGAVAFSAFAYFSYTANIHPIWAAQSCNGCHGNSNLGGLNVNGTAAAVYAGELFNVPTACASGTLIQVAPGGGIPAETASLLIAKLDSISPAACPAPMPPNGILIPVAVRDTIRAWIRAGAPLN